MLFAKTLNISKGKVNYGDKLKNYKVGNILLSL